MPVFSTRSTGMLCDRVDRERGEERKEWLFKPAEAEERGPVNRSEDKSGLGLGRWVLVPADSCRVKGVRGMVWCGVGLVWCGAWERVGSDRDTRKLVAGIGLGATEKFDATPGRLSEWFEIDDEISLRLCCAVADTVRRFERK